MVISWTYLLHAYYRGLGIEYRYFSLKNGRRSFDKTKSGACKHWELERCLNDQNCPLDHHTKNNLRFLIGLRHEIEHQMSMGLDHYLSSRYQACALNYCYYVVHLFGNSQSIDHQLAYSIQFSTVSKEQAFGGTTGKALPKGLKTTSRNSTTLLANEEFQDERYAYRVWLSRKSVNHRGQADAAIEFIDPASEFAKDVDRLYVTTKERERTKYLPSSVCKRIQDEGYPNFKIHNHTELWKQLDGQNPSKGYGVVVEGKWYWYENWIDVVRNHCEDMGMAYK